MKTHMKTPQMAMSNSYKLIKTQGDISWYDVWQSYQEHISIFILARWVGKWNRTFNMDFCQRGPILRFNLLHMYIFID